jgi:cytosine/adenosine deaminase-related metal-dependent hydrolase
MTIYEADWVCPISSAPVRSGRLAVRKGKIVDLPAEAEAVSGNDTVRFPGCAIIPGFVNAHTHLELTVLRGFLDNLPFAEWIPRLTRAKYQVLSRDDLLMSARLGAVEMLRAGVTCLGEVMDIGTSWDAMCEFGLQGVVYQEVFGPAVDQADEALRGLMQKVDHYRLEETETRRVGVSPHAPYTVSSRLYRLVDEYARREHLCIAAHIAESMDEGLFLRSGAGIFAERWRQRGIPVEPPCCSPVEYLHRLGLLRPETLLIHAIDLEESDFELLRGHMPAVVHCPKSNAKLAHAVARIPEIRETGVPLSLGTDSVASNNVIDMFEEMRAAIFQQRGRTQNLDALNAHTAFRMATLGGAESLGLADYLGSLDAGKRADFVVVDLNDPAVQPVYDPIEAMVYSASRRNVRATYIAGRERPTDSSELLREIAHIPGRLL